MAASRPHAPCTQSLAADKLEDFATPFGARDQQETVREGPSLHGLEPVPEAASRSTRANRKTGSWHQILLLLRRHRCSSSTTCISVLHRPASAPSAAGPDVGVKGLENSRTAPTRTRSRSWGKWSSASTRPAAPAWRPRRGQQTDTDAVPQAAQAVEPLTHQAGVPDYGAGRRPQRRGGDGWMYDYRLLEAVR
jgi:hypothetical protein